LLNVRHIAQKTIAETPIALRDCAEGIPLEKSRSPGHPDKRM